MRSIVFGDGDEDGGGYGFLSSVVEGKVVMGESMGDDDTFYN